MFLFYSFSVTVSSITRIQVPNLFGIISSIPCFFVQTIRIICIKWTIQHIKSHKIGLGHKILHSILWEELLEFSIELRRKGLIMSYDHRWFISLLDNIGHRKGSGTGCLSWNLLLTVQSPVTDPRSGQILILVWNDPWSLPMNLLSVFSVDIILEYKIKVQNNRMFVLYFYHLKSQAFFFTLFICNY